MTDQLSLFATGEQATAGSAQEREPWQMTLSEYKVHMRITHLCEEPDEQLEAWHRASIEVVLNGPKNQRRKVPPEVLAEYHANIHDEKPEQPAPTQRTDAKPARTTTTFPDEVEALLRASGLPYVAVDEAKKAMFTHTRLKSFHFVVYQKVGANWLLLVGPMSKANVADMIEWGKVFGDGWMVVFASRGAHGIKFRDINAQAIELETKQ